MMIQEIQSAIEWSRIIAIFWHDNPDWDAIGSMLWLGKILENMGKDVSYFAYPVLSKKFDFVPGSEKIQSSFDYKNKYDLLIFVDFSQYMRSCFTAGKYDYFDNKQLVIIDHHLGDAPTHALLLKDDNADSSAERILENTKDIRSDWYDSDVATCLYLGIATDTGNFKYDKQWSRSLYNAATLVDLGADKRTVAKKMFDTLKLEQLKLLSLVMWRFVTEKGIGYTRYSHQDFEDYGLDREEASGYVIPTVSQIEWLRLAVIFKIESDYIRISFRSQDNLINVSTLAENLGGGGHFYAAGAKVMLKVNEDAVQKMNEIIEDIKNIVG